MEKELKLLLIEDSEDDALILFRELSKGGYKLNSKVVDTEFGLIESLNEQWDLIITDFMLPQFTGLETLRILKENNIDTPCLVISGKTGEATAVEAMKAGAVDYILKESYSRLIPSIERELREAKIRSEKKHVEKALLDSENKYRAIINGIFDLILLCDQEGYIRYVSPNIKQILGYNTYEVVGRKFTEFVHHEDVDKARLEVKELVASLHNRIIEFRIYKKNSEVCSLEVNASVDVDEENGVSKIIAVARDITQRKKTEEDLKISENRYRNLFETNLAAIYQSNMDGRIISCNKAFVKMFGFESIEEVLNINASDFYVYKSDRIKLTNFLEKNGKVTNFQCQLKKKDKSACWVIINAIFEGNKIFLGSMIDFTELKEAEAALRESEFRFRNLIEKNNDIIFTADTKGNLISINPIGQDLITGKFNKEIHIKHILNEETYDSVKKVYNKAIAAKENHAVHEIEAEARNGKMLSFEISYFVNYKKGKPQDVFGIARNITEDKMLQNEVLSKIIEAEEREKKMFAAELHDGLGSMLSTINIYISLLQKKDKSPEERDNYIKYLKKLVSEAISNIRLYANSLTPNVLNDFGLETAISLFIEKVNNAKPGLVEFRCDEINPRFTKNTEINLYRIVLELINNSNKYSNANRIDIDIKNEQNKITLLYKDDGIGFDFERVLGSNVSGMGVKNILARAKSLNGVCDFVSKPNEGTQVKIVINKNN
jgi:PAS domain S-box-containing protein